MLGGVFPDGDYQGANVRHEFLWAPDPAYPIVLDSKAYRVVKTVVAREEGSPFTGRKALFTHYIEYEEG